MTDMDDSDRRWGPRVPYAAYVLVASGERAWLAQVQDLAPGGCGIFRPPGFDLDEADLVTLYFHGDPGPSHVVGARVARVDPGSIGLEYHELQDVPPGQVAANPFAALA